MPAKDHHMNHKTSAECFSCAPTVAVAPERSRSADSCQRPLVAAAAPLGANTIVNEAVDEAFNEGQRARAMLVCA